MKIMRVKYIETFDGQKIVRQSSKEIECEQCEGCGLVNNHVCKSCNGHGCIVLNPDGVSTHRYSKTLEQALADGKLEH